VGAARHSDDALYRVIATRALDALQEGAGERASEVSRATAHIPVIGTLRAPPDIRPE
jgi:hypothetical protein